MHDRGLGEIAEQFGVGYVGEARIGDERFLGRLAIPYRRPAGGEHAVVGMRYRCIEVVLDSNHDCKTHGGNKYLGEHKAPTRLFNTHALVKESPFVAIVEGEMDAMAATLAEVPCVGVAGTGAWKDHFDSAFAGYETVYLIADGDEPGRAFAQQMAERFENAVVIDLGDRQDTNSFILAYGPEAFRERLGL